MKNQNDMIVAIVCAVLGLIAVGAFAGTRPQSRSATVPTPVKVDKPVVAGAEVKMANALPGGGASGRAGGGGGRAPGGFSAPMGRPGGGPGMSGGAGPGAGGPPPAPSKVTGAGG